MTMILNTYISFPPAAASGVPWANVRLLCHFDDSVLDSKTGYALAVSGGPTTYTTGKFGQAKLASTAYAVDSNYGGNHSLFISSSGTFCIEGWVKISSRSASDVFFTCKDVDTNQILIVYSDALGANTNVRIYINGTSYVVNTELANFYDSTWQYIALYRNSANQIRLVTAGGDVLVTTNASQFDIMQFDIPHGTYLMGTDDVRFSTGASYIPTVPTAVFPNS